MFRLSVLCVAVSLLVGCSSFGLFKSPVDKIPLIDDLIKLGEASYSQGDLEQAKKYLIEATESGASNSQVFYRLGTIEFRKGRLDDAAVHFKHAIEIDPRNSKAHYNLATIHLMQAEEHFKYFTATTDPKSNIDAISGLLVEIEKFAEASKVSDRPKKNDKL